MAICVIDKDNNCRANKSVDRRKEKRSYLTVCPLYTMGGRQREGNDVTNDVLRCDKKHQMGWLKFFHNLVPEVPVVQCWNILQMTSKWRRKISNYLSCSEPTNEEETQQIKQHVARSPSLSLSHSQLYYSSLSPSTWTVLTSYHEDVLSHWNKGQAGPSQSNNGTAQTEDDNDCRIPAQWAVLSVGVAWAER